MYSDYNMIAEKLEDGVVLEADVAIAWLKHTCKEMIDSCEAIGIDSVGASVADILGDIELIRDKGWKRVLIKTSEMSLSGITVGKLIE